jgi:hypothetical protein
MGAHLLPHDAKGIESDDFAIEFRGDKIVFVSKGSDPPRHFTLQAGIKSGIIDLHETTDVPNRDERHRTLFAMRRDDLAVLLGAGAPMLAELVNLIRPLKLGWLHHRHIAIARGLEPVNDSDIAVVTRKRKKRLALDAELYEKNVFFPEYLEDVYDFEDGTFSLVHDGWPIGVGFKKTAADGFVYLFWIKRRDLVRLSSKWQPAFEDALADIAIPPHQYQEHPFLRA